MKRSLEKTPTKIYETPLKIKTENKGQKEQSEADKKRDEKALKSLMQEIDEIEDYLEGKGLQPETHSKEQL